MALASMVAQGQAFLVSMVLLLAFSSQLWAQPLDDGTLEELLPSCGLQHVQRVLQSCHSEGSDIWANSPRLAIASMLSSCLTEANYNNNTTLRPLRIVAPEGTLLHTLSQLASSDNTSSFSKATGVPVRFVLLPAGTFSATRGQLLRDPLPPDADRGYDAIMVAPTAFGDAAQVPGKLLDMSYIVSDDKMLDWEGIRPQFRGTAVTYDGAVVALPLLPVAFFTFYHLEIFQRDGLTPPRTWDEFADLAERYHGREGLVGACLWLPNCRGESFVLRYILGSYVQTHGASQGVVWDAETLQPLANTEAMEAALRILRRLRAVGLNTSSIGAPCVPRDFNVGRCLLAVNDAGTFKSTNLNSSPMRGRLGMALLPGSTRVLDRPSGRLVTCDKARCPLAQDYITEQNGTLTPINRAPIVGNTVILLNGLSPSIYQFWAYTLFAYLTSPKVIGSAGLLMEDNEAVPVRAQDLAPDTAYKWVQHGYEAGDVARFLDVYGTVTDSTNPYVDLKTRFSSNVTAALLQAGLTATNMSMAADVAMQRAMTQLDAALQSIEAAVGPEAFGSEYRRSLNWQPSPPPASPPPPPAVTAAAATRRRFRHLAAVVAAPCAVALLFAASLAAAVVVVRRRRAAEQVLVEAAWQQAPGVSLSTALVVTDIQDSTPLWEALDAAVMDAALKVHHCVVREVLRSHLGYESATEGDSFILAFHTPQHAVGFCLAAQQALLDAPWPRELLQHAPLPAAGDTRGTPAGLVLMAQRPPVKTTSRSFQATVRGQTSAVGGTNSQRQRSRPWSAAAAGVTAAASAASNHSPPASRRIAQLQMQTPALPSVAAPRKSLLRLSPALLYSRHAAVTPPAACASASDMLASAPTLSQLVVEEAGTRHAHTTAGAEGQDLAIMGASLIVGGATDTSSAAAVPIPVFGSAPARTPLTEGSVGSRSDRYRVASPVEMEAAEEGLLPPSQSAPIPAAPTVLPLAARTLGRPSLPDGMLSWLTKPLGGLPRTTLLPLSRSPGSKRGAQVKEPPGVFTEGCSASALTAGPGITPGLPTPRERPHAAAEASRSSAASSFFLRQSILETIYDGSETIELTCRTQSLAPPYIAPTAQNGTAPAAAAVALLGTAASGTCTASSAAGWTDEKCIPEAPGAVATTAVPPGGDSTGFSLLALVAASGPGSGVSGSVPCLLPWPSGSIRLQGNQASGPMPPASATAPAAAAVDGAPNHVHSPANCHDTAAGADPAVMGAVMSRYSSTVLVPTAAEGVWLREGTSPFLSPAPPHPLQQPPAGHPSGPCTSLVSWLRQQWEGVAITAATADESSGPAMPRMAAGASVLTDIAAACSNGFGPGRIASPDPSRSRGRHGQAGGAISSGVVRVVVFRGLRVRMGCACRVNQNTDVLRNHASGRVQYSGPGLRLAKAVSDAANGGTVLLSDCVYNALCNEGSACAKALQHMQLLWLGRFTAGADLPPVHLIQAVTRGSFMLGRLAVQGPLRNVTPVPPLGYSISGGGALSAPMTGFGTVARIAVATIGTLLAWNTEVAHQALNVLYDGLLDSLVAVTNGEEMPYVVEGTFGLYGGGSGGGFGGGNAAPEEKSLPLSSGEFTRRKRRLTGVSVVSNSSSGSAMLSTRSAADDNGGDSSSAIVVPATCRSRPRSQEGEATSPPPSLLPASQQVQLAQLLTLSAGGGSGDEHAARLCNAGQPPQPLSQQQQTRQLLSVPEHARHVALQQQSGKKSLDLSVSGHLSVSPGRYSPRQLNGALQFWRQVARQRAGTGGVAGGGSVGGGMGGGSGGGDSVNDTQGSMTVIFRDPTQAARWLLRVLETMPSLPWPAELLQNPMYEALAVDGAGRVALRPAMLGWPPASPLTVSAGELVASGTATPLAHPDTATPRFVPVPENAPAGANLGAAVVSAATGITATSRSPLSTTAVMAATALAPGRNGSCSSNIGSGVSGASGGAADRAIGIRCTDIEYGGGNGGGGGGGGDGDSDREGCSSSGAVVLLRRGLRARAALVYGELQGEMPGGGSLACQLSYKGRAWSLSRNLLAKGKPGEVASDEETAALLPQPLASRLSVSKGS